MEKQNLKVRIRYTLAFLFLIIVEVLIAKYVHDAFIRPYVGDMLVVMVVYCGIRIFFGKKGKWLPLFVFLFASFVECLQYFQLVKVLGVEDNRFLRILIGSTFDGKDIICYGVGCLILGIWERRMRKEGSHEML